ncbi:MAG: cell division protein FtsQ/DivIB [Nitrosomonadaceae bacterium]|nr:cell division protein FtsQ/DivIB [Nitrosomonadaceae bacterium]
MWDNHHTLHLLANLLFALVALAAAYAIGSWAVSSSVFPLKQVSVSGINNSNGELRHVTREQIDKVVRSKIAGNFLTVDLDATRDAFEKLPWVRVAGVRRHWPQTLEVTLEEHVAVARWGSEALVNTHGEVFDGAVTAVEGGLPVFIGPPESSFDVARQYAAFGKLLQPLRQNIAQLNLSPRRAWRIHLENGTVLELGRDQMEARLARYVLAYGRSLAQLNQQLAYVDLRYSNGFAVRMPEASQQEPRKLNLKKAA